MSNRNRYYDVDHPNGGRYSEISHVELRRIQKNRKLQLERERKEREEQLERDLAEHEAQLEREREEQLEREREWAEFVRAEEERLTREQHNRERERDRERDRDEDVHIPVSLTPCLKFYIHGECDNNCVRSHTYSQDAFLHYTDKRVCSRGDRCYFVQKGVDVFCTHMHQKDKSAYGVTRLARTIEKFDKKISDLQKEREELTDGLIRANSRANQRSADLNRADRVIDDLHAELNAMQASRDESEKMRDAAESELAELKRKLNALKPLIEDLAGGRT